MIKLNLLLFLLHRRGQLGHNELENCDDPKLIEALAGLKIVQISAGGWHTAVITDQVSA